MAWSVGFMGASLSYFSDYWVSIYGQGTTTYEAPQGIAIDSSGNTYLIGYAGGYPIGATNKMFLAKLDSKGRKLWQKYYQNGSYEAYGTEINFGADGYLYVSANSYETVGYTIVMKLTTDGGIVWQQKVGDGVNGYTMFHNRTSTVDPFGNTTTIVRGGVGTYTTARFNTGGSVFSGNFFKPAHASGGYFDQVLIEGSTQNVYYAGDFSSTGNFFESFGIISKTSETGGHLWSMYYNNPSTNYSSVSNLWADTTYVYTVSYTSPDSGSGLYAIVTKFNGSNGSVVWSRAVSNAFFRSVAVNAAGDVYVYGENRVNNAMYIAKWNSSGTLQWQRDFTNVSPFYTPVLRIDSANNLYMSIGYYTSAYDACIGAVKLPGDGSLTGTYGEFTYSAASLTESAAPHSWASTSMSMSTTSVGVTAGALVASDTNQLPTTRANIG